ncbi:MAG: hypothetical protein FJ267_14225 [Planctomycetes bacterium]|nr:hypothetical protein [Planctomycetota bacterium]
MSDVEEMESEGGENKNGRAPHSRVMSSRALLNFWLDVVLFMAVVFIAWVSAVTYVVFLAPTSADGWKLWGMTFDQWNDLQASAMCVCGLLAIEHLVLHWNWVCSIIATKILRRKKGAIDEATQAIYGVGTFIVIVLLVLSSIVAASLSVQKPAR